MDVQHSRGITERTTRRNRPTTVWRRAARQSRMGNRERLERQNFSGVAALPQELTVSAIVCADVNDQIDRVVLN